MLQLNPHASDGQVVVPTPKPHVSTSLESPLTPTSRSLKEAILDGSEIVSSVTVPSSIGDVSSNDHSGNTQKPKETELDKETMKPETEAQPTSDGELTPQVQPEQHQVLLPSPRNAAAAAVAAHDSPVENDFFSNKGLSADKPWHESSGHGDKDVSMPIRAVSSLEGLRRHTSPNPITMGRKSADLTYRKKSIDTGDHPLAHSRSHRSRSHDRALSSIELHNLRQHSHSSASAEINRMRNSILVKRNIQKRRRDYMKEDQVYVGNKITEGHQNFVMAYNMLTGIRVAVSRCSGVMKKLNDSDFSATKKLTFSMDGSELTPSSKYDFKFKDYSPEVFRELRSLFGIDPADYLISITGKYILSELGSPGKSGSFFYYSRDFRFIIKTIHHSEHKQLRRMLKDYYQHVKDNPNTLISQFYGLHRLKVHGGMKKVHFIVMNNLFPPHRDIHLKYDLKGSTWGRSTTIPKGTTDFSQMTLKDLNWLDRHDTIKFGPEKRKMFLEQLEADVGLLKKTNVMDYSLLLGIHDVKKGNTETKQKLSVFDPKSNMKAEVIKTNPRHIDRGVDLPTDVFPGRSKYIFYGHNGGIRATNENNDPLPEIYYLGIIDCLTNYSTKKRLETFWRSLSHPRSTISAVPAREYGDRFIQFMKNGISIEKAKTA